MISGNIPDNGKIAGVIGLVVAFSFIGGFGLAKVIEATHIPEKPDFIKTKITVNETFLQGIKNMKCKENSNVVLTLQDKYQLLVQCKGK